LYDSGPAAGASTKSLPKQMLIQASEKLSDP